MDGYATNSAYTYKEAILERISALPTDEEKAKFIIEERNRLNKERAALEEILQQESDKNGYPLIIYTYDKGERPISESEKVWHKAWIAAGCPQWFRGVMTIGDS